MFLDASWVDHKGQESWVNAMAGHIRRSIDMTLLEEKERGVRSGRGQHRQSTVFPLWAVGRVYRRDVGVVDVPRVCPRLASVVQLVREFATLPILHPVEGGSDSVGSCHVASDR